MNKLVLVGAKVGAQMYEAPKKIKPTMELIIRDSQTFNHKKSYHTMN